MREDTPIAQLDFPITGPDPYVKVEPHFPIDIAFENGGPVVPILKEVGTHVAHVVFGRLRQFFPPIYDWELAEVLPPVKRLPSV